MEEIKRGRKPKAEKMIDKQLDQAAEQFEKFESDIKSLTMDRMSSAPKQETEPQTKLSSNQIANSKAIYLKPEKYIACSPKDRFNEAFRKDYEFDKEYVQFIAENNEIKGETIDIWTRPYGGMPAEYWKVPCNKPIWGPRYLAEQIKRKVYHRLQMQQHQATGLDGMGQYFGSMVVDTTIARLEARPVSSRKSVFVGV